MMESDNLLIVDDDPRICRLLARYLTGEGYRVHTAGSGAEMRHLLALEQPRLIILDLLLPDADGFGLARELRASSGVPIIILSGKAETVDKVVGLELGADDYITKPFDERELLARVRTVLRRTANGTTAGSNGDHSVACFGGWKLHVEAHELTAPSGEPVKMTSHEFGLLAALVEHGNRVMTRKTILDLLAGREWSPDDRSVDVLVGKLRRKLGDDPQNPRLIETVRGVGYKLTTKVQFL